MSDFVAIIVPADGLVLSGAYSVCGQNGAQVCPDIYVCVCVCVLLTLER